MTGSLIFVQIVKFVRNERDASSENFRANASGV